MFKKITGGSVARGDKAKTQTEWGWEMVFPSPETPLTAMTTFATRGVREGRPKLLIVYPGLWFIAYICHLHLYYSYLTEMYCLIAQTPFQHGIKGLSCNQIQPYASDRSEVSN